MSGRFSYDPGARLLTVDDRRFPARSFDGTWGARDVVYGEHAHCTRRVRVMRENGYQLSLIWGSGTYSDNYDHTFGQPQVFVEEPERVEVGVYGPERGGELLELGDPESGYTDSVAGYCTTDDVLRLIRVVSMLSTSEVPEVSEFAREGS